MSSPSMPTPKKLYGPSAIWTERCGLQVIGVGEAWQAKAHMRANGLRHLGHNP